MWLYVIGGGQIDVQSTQRESKALKLKEKRLNKNGKLLSLNEKKKKMEKFETKILKMRAGINSMILLYSALV